MPQKAYAAVRVINRSAHVKYLNLGDGESVALAPTDDGAPGLLIKFDSQAEKERFEKATQTAGVQQWIDQGELQIKDAPVDAPVPPSAAEQVARTAADARDLAAQGQQRSDRVLAEPAPRSSSPSKQRDKE